MKSRIQELVDRSQAAMMAGIEIYNKPSFSYRIETFVILSINAWELLFKAKWLELNGNRERCLFVKERRETKIKEKTKKLFIKRTESGNPFTYSLGYLGKKLAERNVLDRTVLNNISLLTDFRDSAVHYYNKSPFTLLMMQEIGMSCIKNYVAVIKQWFASQIASINMQLMPFAFTDQLMDVENLQLSPEEQNFIKLIEKLSADSMPEGSPYSVVINVQLQLSKAKSSSIAKAILSNDPNAIPLALSDEQLLDKYRLTYDELTRRCQKRYTDFIVNKQYHDLRREIAKSPKFGIMRYLDPRKPQGQKKPYFSEAIFTEFDKHYHKNEA